MESVLIKTTPEYEFYSDGKIWSNYYQRFLDGWYDGGYNYVGINGKSVKRHRIIAETFIQNPNNLPEVHHIDFDKTNNSVSNLVFLTRKQHMDIHKERWAKIMSKANHNSPKLSKPIEMLTLSWEHEAYFPSMMECKRQYNIPTGNIAKVCNGERQQAGGHRFRYCDPSCLGQT